MPEHHVLASERQFGNDRSPSVYRRVRLARECSGRNTGDTENAVTEAAPDLCTDRRRSTRRSVQALRMIGRFPAKWRPDFSKQAPKRYDYLLASRNLAPHQPWTL